MIDLPSPARPFLNIYLGTNTQYMIYPACFRVHTGGELLQAAAESSAGDAILKQLWHHSDAIMCCSVKTNVRF